MDLRLKASCAMIAALVGAGVAYRHADNVPARAPERAGDRFIVVLEPELHQCRRAAQLHFDIAWASACLAVATRQQARHAMCLREQAVQADTVQAHAHCDRLHGEEDGASDCTLPDERAALLNAAYQASDDLCLAEARRRTAD